MTVPNELVSLHHTKKRRFLFTIFHVVLNLFSSAPLSFKKILFDHCVMTFELSLDSLSLSVQLSHVQSNHMVGTDLEMYGDTVLLAIIMLSDSMTAVFDHLGTARVMKWFAITLYGPLATMATSGCINCRLLLTTCCPAIEARITTGTWEIAVTLAIFASRQHIRYTLMSPVWKLGLFLWSITFCKTIGFT